MVGRPEPTRSHEKREHVGMIRDAAVYMLNHLVLRPAGREPFTTSYDLDDEELIMLIWPVSPPAPQRRGQAAHPPTWIAFPAYRQSAAEGHGLVPLPRSV